MNDDCPVFRPDHNGECLNCDEWMDEHTPDAIAAGEALVRMLTPRPPGPHAKLAADTWRLIRALQLEGGTRGEQAEAEAVAINVIEIACDSAVEAERALAARERLKGS